MRVLVFSIAALVVLSLSSCTKESALATEPLLQEDALRQKSLGEMNHALQETMEVLEPLKKLSGKDAEALKNSTDLPADLAKFGVDVEIFQRHAQRFNAALQEARNLGASDEILVASMKKHSEPIVRKIEAAYPEAAYAKSTPCYDAWENDFNFATQMVALCAVGAMASESITLFYLCYFGYVLELIHIYDEFETCLGNNYGG